jgi:hypothetical protein
MRQSTVIAHVTIVFLHIFEFLFSFEHGRDRPLHPSERNPVTDSTIFFDILQAHELTVPAMNRNRFLLGVSRKQL